MRTSDTTTFDLGQAKLRLKDGLKFSIQIGKYENWYLIEDEVTGGFYRIGETEYAFLSALDGKTTLSTALAKTCTRVDSRPLSEQDAINFCRWLVETGLASTRHSASSAREQQRKDAQAQQRVVEKLNPISLRMTFWNPDSWVSNVARFTNPILGWPLAAAWLLLCSYAAILLASDWNRFTHGTVQAITRDGIVWIGLSWFVLKFAHETAHALACKRFGGSVDGCGILLLLLIPLPFVDVTSTWKFTSKYQRIFVSAAGMLAELAIASVAVIVWANTDVGIWNTLASNVIVAASLHTLLFNANPLMRFDGYHMLTDWLEIPNLGNHGSQYVRGRLKRLFFGTAPPPFSMVGAQGWIVKSYGVAATIWKMILCITLTIAALNLFSGIGLLMALFAATMWVIVPAVRVLHSTILSEVRDSHALSRFAMVSLGAVACVILAAGLPAPTVVTAPFVIDYDDKEIVRAETSGFIESVEVEENETVAPGQLLVVLRNPELESEIANLRLQRAQAYLRQRIHKNAGDIALSQLEAESVREIDEQIAELELNRQRLQIRSPIAGEIVATNLQSLVGRHVRVGQELLSVGARERKEAIALVAQHDSPSLKDIRGKAIELRVWGHNQLERGKIEEVSPKSRDDVPHFSFAGIHGGPLAVIDRSRADSEGSANVGINDNLDTASESMKLVDSRFRVSVALDPSASSRLLAGQTGVIQLRSRSERLGPYVLAGSMRWLRDRIRISHGL